MNRALLLPSADEVDRALQKLPCTGDGVETSAGVCGGVSGGGERPAVTVVTPGDSDVATFSGRCEEKGMGQGTGARDREVGAPSPRLDTLVVVKVEQMLEYDEPFIAATAATGVVADVTGSAAVPRVCPRSCAMDDESPLLVPPEGGALYTAARNGDLEAVTALLRVVVDVDHDGGEGRTPLLIAAQYGHVAVVEALMEAAAEVDVSRHSDKTPLYVAARHGHAAVITALVRAGADVDRRGNKKVGEDGATPLIVATQNGHKAAVAALLCAGATLDSALDNGCTALWCNPPTPQPPNPKP